MSELIVPHVVDMEKSILGAMLLKGGQVIPKIRSVLCEDDFYRIEHKIIYRILLKMYDEGVEPNILSLSEELRKAQELDRVSLQYLFALSESAWTTGYAEKHAEVIREKATLRKLMLLGEVLQENASRDIKPCRKF